MKKTILYLIGLTFSITLNGQNQESNLSEKLISGHPKELEQIINQLRLTNTNNVSLKTGIDSINIYFGQMTQLDNNGYWISRYINGNPKSFETVSLNKNDSTETLSNNVDIKYDNSSKRISLQIEHIPSSNEIVYNWLDHNEKSKVLTIAKIERPIEKEKQFPELTLESLNGETISLQDYKGKYIIINWWATSCAPCRKEIPGLNKLVEKYKSNQDLVFLSIAFDRKERLNSFLKRNEFNYIHTLGNKDVAKIFGASYPKNIIVNPDGIVTYYSEGGNEYKSAEIEMELKKQLNIK